jgi:DMSO/TMAO reductase YedYZ molybdopterin-dependent catalytic subunit
MTRGFFRRHAEPAEGDRLPPGQYLERGFPVLSAGPTPRVPLDRWDFAVTGAVGEERRWTWDEFHALERETITKDIHCVTSWSKFDTAWEGVAIDDILADAGLSAPTPFALAHCYDGYSTNVPLADLATGKAMIALKYEGQPLPRDHGGPARLLVPHLYFWKSAKWVNGLQFTERNEAGFWELRGYHMYGDPWHEQRYTND